MVFLKLSGWFSARLGPTPLPLEPRVTSGRSCWYPGFASPLHHMGSSLCFCVICYDVETATIYQPQRVVERTSWGLGESPARDKGLIESNSEPPSSGSWKCECSVHVLTMSQACSKHFTCTIQSILLHWRPGVRKMTTAKLVFGISLPRRTYCIEHTFNSHPGELP